MNELPKRSASELATALRQRTALLTGETWERTATAAMMNEAADLLDSPRDGAPALSEELAEQINALESWQVDDPLSPFTGSHVVDRDDVLAIIAAIDDLPERDGAPAPVPAAEQEYPWDKIRAECWSQVQTIFRERGPDGELWQFYRAAPVDNARRLDDEQIRVLRDENTKLKAQLAAALPHAPSDDWYRGRISGLRDLSHAMRKVLSPESLQSLMGALQDGLSAAHAPSQQDRPDSVAEDMRRKAAHGQMWNIPASQLLAWADAIESQQPDVTLAAQLRGVRRILDLNDEDDVVQAVEELVAAHAPSPPTGWQPEKDTK